MLILKLPDLIILLQDTLWLQFCFFYCWFIKLGKWIFFYPIGITLSFIILVVIYYLLIKGGLELRRLLKYSVEPFIELSEWMYYYNLYFSYICNPVIILWEVFEEISNFVDNYDILYYLKKIDLHIYWFLIITLFL